MDTTANVIYREPWNKGKLVGQKAPFKLKDICVLTQQILLRSCR